MQTLSAPQCATLANFWTDYASALGDYENDHLGQVDIDTARLSAWIIDAAARGNNFAKQALALSFNDVDADFAALTNVMKQATAYTKSLEGLVQTWNRCARVATAMMALADAIAVPGSGIIAAAVGVAKAYTGNSDAKATDPAPAP